MPPARGVGRATPRGAPFVTIAAALVGMLLATPLALAGCGRVDDPTFDIEMAGRFTEPPPPLRDLDRDPRRHVFFGDLHIHTSHSYDAYTFGVRALPDDAYAFARGETIRHAFGYPIRARRPLDFAAVTDHAEYLGAARALDEADGGDETPLGEVVASGNRLWITWRFLSTTLGQMTSVEEREASFGGVAEAAGAEAWADIVAAAARHDRPGRFTTFVAYEWTSMPDERNLHRNVVYRTAQVPERPFSARDGEDPEDLWRALEAQRARGMEMIAIPHNGNVSDGRMYDRVRFDGSPLDADYAATRMRNEPISEILQVKGQSEAHPALSPADEFAAFELFDEVMSVAGEPSEPRGSYARDALRAGLELSAAHGFNPYRFGVIGSSDSHNASASVEEDDYHGKLPMLDGSAGLRLGESFLLPEDELRGLRWGAAGLAAVWAEENTRAALFDAMRRKETYATSGPRLVVRFFGGFDYAPGLVDAPDFVARADAGGVPMGGELAGDGTGRAPRFAVVAEKDPIGANLDRIQIVKGFVDAEGRSHERIHDVAASDGRRPDPATGRVAPLPSTVDVAGARYRNDVGAARLATVWTDPDFDPDREAFYYARVLEIETPRWSTYDAAAMGVAPPEPATLQERAITSAIGYRPARGPAD